MEAAGHLPTAQDPALERGNLGSGHWLSVGGAAGVCQLVKMGGKQIR